MDRVYRHNCKPPHFFLEKWVINPPFQFSYKPLGDPDPPIFNLGVAILLVRLFSKSHGFLAILTYSTSFVATRHHSLGDFLCGC